MVWYISVHVLKSLGACEIEVSFSSLEGEHRQSLTPVLDEEAAECIEMMEEKKKRIDSLFCFSSIPLQTERVNLRVVEQTVWVRHIFLHMECAEN